LWKGANKCEDQFGNPTDIGINGFKAYRSYWSEHPDRDEVWAAEQRSQLGEDRFRREMDCIAHDAVLTLRDLTGKVFKSTISELKEILSRRT
jgi:hypothetical protein